jgi:hypothetical protein
MHFGLCTYDWRDGAYRPPVGTVGAVDLRPVPEQGMPGVQGSGPVVVCSAVPIPRESLIRPFGDATAALDYTWRALTTGSDPLGLGGPKPLMPMTDGNLLLRLGPVSRVQRFRMSSPHANRVRAVLASDFGEMWERTNGDDHCRRVLDMTCEKRGHEEWRVFVPRRLRSHVPGRLLHATTLSDNFNRANETLTTPWVQDATGMTIVSNQLRCLGTPAIGYYNSPLSSDDMETSITRVSKSGVNGGGGCYARKQSGATDNNTYLNWCDSADGHQLYKFVGGSLTSLASGGATWANGSVMLCGADGSTIYSKKDGTTSLSVTDTAHTGYLYAGFRAYDSPTECTWDDWQAADIGAAPSGNPWYYYNQQRLAG